MEETKEEMGDQPEDLTTHEGKRQQGQN